MSDQPQANNICSTDPHHFVWTWPINDDAHGSIGVCELCGAVTTAERDARLIAEAKGEALRPVRAAHPVTEARRCGARLAAPVDPPPGPVSPPIWCALPDDGHDRHRTYDGRWLDLFSRPIEERPPVITYRCEACGVSGRTPAPCPTLAAIEGAQGRCRREHEDRRGLSRGRVLSDDIPPAEETPDA